MILSFWVERPIFRGELLNLRGVYWEVRDNLRFYYVWRSKKLMSDVTNEKYGIKDECLIVEQFKLLIKT